MNWLDQLEHDPTRGMLSSDNAAISHFVRRDLLGEDVEPISRVWELPEVGKLLWKQRPDGSWRYPGKRSVSYPPHHYELVETFKRFRFLVERYQLTRDHPVAEKAAEYLFSCQTGEGDIRGMIGNQYATYYTGAIMAHLIEAGYAEDPRIEGGFRWLLSMRQDDGGWTIPILTHKLDRETSYRLTSEEADPLEPDRSKPFSHNWTDMVLRAFAAHPRYRLSPEARAAGALLKSRFFKPDAYSSYRAASYWVRFAFWWPNLLTSLDSLSRMGFTKDDPDIEAALDWLVEHQQPDGLWNITYVGGKSAPDNQVNRERRLWVSLAVARIFKRFYA
ncbi:hypothetical protein H8E65_12490 [Candidatus Bathyarchaeota archaeon]|nr:hypothetical protein [Candidatus Bathyarchaeota archaeon]MBL7080705.1 hypothetical protein [Candidatus Bathyarchaeota archaeon]